MNLKIVNKVFKNTIICFFLFYNIVLSSQETSIKTANKKEINVSKSEAEIIKITKDYIAKKEFSKASLLLSENYKKFSESININWLYALVLSKVDEKRKARKIYKKAISLDPKNKNIQMDYARFLYEIGKIDKSQKVMTNFMNDNSKNVEFLLMQANISFWKTDILNARKKINRIKEIYPNTDITKNLEKQIEDLTVFYLKTDFEYQTDSQPLDYFANHVVLGEFISKFASPQLEISRYSFSPQSESALILKLSNRFYFDYLKLSTIVTGGMYMNHSGKSDWVGGLRFEKNIVKNLTLDFGYTKSALLGTIASTTFNLTQEDLFGEIDYSNKWIVLNAGYNYKFFEDENNIKSIGSWVVSQPIKFNKFNFQFGYGFSYTDSEDILFFYDNIGEGIYDPYFTPKDQNIHSALLIFNYKPIKKLNLKAKINYGIEATVQNPYPLEVLPNVFEIGGFYEANFNYREYVGSVDYSISNKFRINAIYTYQETFFYTRNNINLGLNFTF